MRLIFSTLFDSCQQRCGSFAVCTTLIFVKRSIFLRAAVRVLVGPCCPALLNCTDVDVHAVVLFGKQNGDLCLMTSCFRLGLVCRMVCFQFIFHVFVGCR